MEKKSISNLTVLFLCLIIATLNIYARSFYYLNWDTAGLVYEAKRVLNGEVLNKDFLEINPPLIVYLNLIPAWINKITNISLPVSLLIFFNSIGLISLTLTLPRVENLGQKIIIIFFAFIPLGHYFGQREHLYILFILPYFISIINPKPLSKEFNILTGLWAGIGFSLKPYFMVAWFCGVLLRFIWLKKSYLITKISDLIIAFIISTYILFLLLIEQEYIFHVIPFLIKYYNLFNNHNLVLKTVFGDLIGYGIAFFLVLIFKRNLLNQKIYITSCAFALSLIVILLQDRPFYYYQYPVMFFGVYTNILIIDVLVKAYKLRYVFLSPILLVIAILSFLKSDIWDFSDDELILNNDYKKQIINVYNQYAANDYVYFLGIKFGLLYIPELIYSKAETKSYYGLLWPIPTMYGYSENLPVKYRYPEQRTKDENLLIKNILNDLKAKPPKIIIIENDPSAWEFNYLKYFLLDPEFEKIWQNYQLLTSIKGQDIYVLNHN